ncbi:hypothetical protein BC628DRAFT_1358874 [Trametes gibbosa]|nr:hypothetical protein BC628DRAFT_1358874 [Trametes gibbosa]
MAPSSSTRQEQVRQVHPIRKRQLEGGRGPPQERSTGQHRHPQVLHPSLSQQHQVETHTWKLLLLRHQCCQRPRRRPRRCNPQCAASTKSLPSAYRARRRSFARQLQGHSHYPPRLSRRDLSPPCH